ncbi:hypothetical protein CDL12_00307 [Handroanthus impetiginosus]|uniref:WEB family protein n=1 Tax=Handroanthus impetiginosus TaxID=429701 RepID=A0A2G9IBA1_9LAMI|nr:hypothetical protein CDL12_00307 [Handroanthus impetiginosus]
MEQVQSLDQAAIVDHHSNVDTSRPFRSVKEAVAILGERFLTGETYFPKPFSFPEKETPFFSPQRVDTESSWECLSRSPSSQASSYSHDIALVETVKKLEVELNETKAELKLLKERESENEVALALLNAELHENMSKLALAEAAAIAKTTTTTSRSILIQDHGDTDCGGITKEEDEKGDLLAGMERGPSSRVAQILSFGEKGSLSFDRKNERKGMKKKTIIPLVGDLFSKKKGSPTTLDNPLFGSI